MSEVITSDHLREVAKRLKVMDHRGNYSGSDWAIADALRTIAAIADREAAQESLGRRSTARGGKDE